MPLPLAFVLIVLVLLVVIGLLLRRKNYYKSTIGDFKRANYSLARQISGVIEANVKLSQKNRELKRLNFLLMQDSVANEESEFQGVELIDKGLQNPAAMQQALNTNNDVNAGTPGAV